MGVDELINAIRGIATATPSGQIPASATNDDAAAGKIGEVLSTAVATGAAVSLTTNTAKDIATKALTAGHWLVKGLLYFNLGATSNVTALQASLSQTTDTMDYAAGSWAGWANDVGVVLGNTFAQAVVLPPLTVKLASTTTLRLVGLGKFTVSTCAGWGLLEATRVR